MNENTARPERRLLVSAFGIHMGGGLVLLEALLRAAASDIREALVDARLPAADGRAGIEDRCQPVARSFRARLSALDTMSRRASASDVLLCFNSLPPLRSSRAYVVNYVHAPHFAGAHVGIEYGRMTRIRHVLERTWFRCGARNCDEIWVQTPSMATALQDACPANMVRVVPFVDDALLSGLRQEADDAPPLDFSRWSFFYPADGVAHKNHCALLQAWQLLSRDGLQPRLMLTLRPDEWLRVQHEARVDLARLPMVSNAGRLSRDSVLDQLHHSSALIFPSLAETFGLPLLEARAAGIPIVASERDFVRDVCTPSESFDPTSPRSIALAVRRFVTGASPPAARFHSSAEFVAALRARRR